MLLVAAVALVLIADSTETNPITLASVDMFSPIVAGLTVCLSRNIQLADVGLRRGRLRLLVVAASIALALIGPTLAFAVTTPGVAVDLIN